MRGHRYSFHRKLLTALLTITILSAILAALTAFSPFLTGPGLSNPEPIGAYLNGVFPNEAPSNGQNVSYTIEEAFPELTFIDPVKMVEAPGNQFMVVGKQGKIWLFNNDEATTTKVKILDISNQTVVGADGGMLGLALHPEFGQAGSANRGYLYVWYRFAPQLGVHGRTGYMRLSRFTLEDGATLIDPASELPMIQQFDRHDWHNGGDMFFGPDGFLHISVGDEGGANDQFNTTQRIDLWLFGGVLRIDVDKRGGSISHPIRRQPQNQSAPPAGWPNSFTQEYYIPNDNPWQNSNGDILEEFYAIGLRSPHRMTYDPVEDEIWIGDVGQGSREDISIVQKGDNMQWPYKEGDINGPKPQPNPLIGNDKPPIYAYPRTFGRCVIGGFVYRGSKFPELAGKYFFGDHEVQNVWTLTKDENGGAPDIQFLLQVPTFGTGSKDGISSFYVDSQEDIYILKLFGTNTDGGKIYKLSRTGATAEPPATLSALGVFNDLNTLTPIPGIIPYTVNSPLWSDRAEKKRWIALPNDGNHNIPSEQIVFDSEDNWQFPPGTVMIKHFELPVDEGNPSITKRLETRFFIFDHTGGAYGITYKWNADGTEAFLLLDGDIRDLTVTRTNGSTYTQTWDFPSRQQCMDCHNSVAGYALGVKTRQLNRDFTYPSTGTTSNQLETWNHLGMFDSDMGLPEDHPKSSFIGDVTASVQHRVRSYMDANCAFCHRPNGVEGAFDARARTALHDQMLIDTPVISHASPPGMNVVEAGDPQNSVLWIRDNSLGDDAMPPLAKNVIHSEYIQVLSDWITSLNVDPPETLADGWYTLEVRHSGKIASVENNAQSNGARIVQKDNVNGDNQKWEFTNLGSNKYRILAGHSNRALSVEDWEASAGSNLVQQDWQGKQNQIWYLSATNSGFYSFTNAYSGLFVEISEGSSNENRWAVTAQPGQQPHQQWKPIPTTAPGGGTTTETIYLSDLNWSSTPTNGWGPVERDRSNGETGATDGNTITINGQTYAKGLGAHAYSEIVYDLNAEYDVFKSDIGVDDETCGSGSIQFEVYLDGQLEYQSPILTQADDALSIEAEVYGTDELKLIIKDGGNGIGCDHGDWADARLEKTGTSSGNQAPVVSNPGDQISNIGEIVSLTIGASDPENQPLSFLASNLPAGLNLDSSTGEITGMPTSVGIYSTVVTVSDGEGDANAAFNWTIADNDPCAGLLR
ncbi:MAG: NPCBM/NEW2 domain-containing protein, partial [Calditrichia bacterium]